MFNYKTDLIDYAHKIDEATKPSEAYEKHMHIFYEVIYFVKGDVKYTVESETHKLQKGDIILISPGKYHFATVNSDVPYERYVLKFSDKILPSYLIDKIKNEKCFYAHTSSLAYHFANLDDYSVHYKGLDLQTMFIAELAQIIVKLLDQPTHEFVESNEFITELINYIDDNIQSKITLESLSKHFNFSKSYISQEFKRIMKTPVIHYIKTKKIIAAHQLILQGENKTEVAEKFGFSEYSTFYRAYKKIIENS